MIEPHENPVKTIEKEFSLHFNEKNTDFLVVLKEQESIHKKSIRHLESLISHSQPLPHDLSEYTVKLSEVKKKIDNIAILLTQCGNFK